MFKKDQDINEAFGKCQQQLRKKSLFLIQIESYSLMVFCNIEINDDNYSSEPKAEEGARLVFGPC